MTIDQILQLKCVCCDKLSQLAMPACESDDPSIVVMGRDGASVPMCLECAQAVLASAAEETDQMRAAQARQLARAAWRQTPEGQADYAREKKRRSFKRQLAELGLA